MRMVQQILAPGVEHAQKADRGGFDRDDWFRAEQELSALGKDADRRGDPGSSPLRAF
jgi:hypothetical protein